MLSGSISIPFWYLMLMSMFLRYSMFITRYSSSTFRPSYFSAFAPLAVTRSYSGFPTTSLWFNLFWWSASVSLPPAVPFQLPISIILLPFPWVPGYGGCYLQPLFFLPMVLLFELVISLTEFLVGVGWDDGNLEVVFASLLDVSA